MKVMLFFVKDVSFPSIHMSFPNAQPTSKWVRTNRSVQTTLAFRQSLGRVASNHSWWWLLSYEIYSPQKTYGTWIRPPRRNFWNFLWWVQGIARPFGGVRKGRSPNDTLNPAIFSGGCHVGGVFLPLNHQPPSNGSWNSIPATPAPGSLSH